MSLLLKHGTETIWAAGQGLSIAEIWLANKPVYVFTQPTEHNTILKQQFLLQCISLCCTDMNTVYEYHNL